MLFQNFLPMMPWCQCYWQVDKSRRCCFAGAFIFQCKSVYRNRHFTDCAAVCQDIIDGKYGTYALETRWDAPFDYNNAQSKEMVFGFPGSFGLTHWQYDGGMYFWMLPYQAPRYFGFTDFGDANPKYALQPGRDVDSVEYTFDSG